MFREDFAGRVLPFDGESAAIYGELFAVRRRPVTTGDLMIAATAPAGTARAW